MPEGSADGKLAMQATEAKPVVVFGTIKYSEPGTYKYTIVETDDGVKDIIYDTTTHNVIVTVTDPNADGRLVCEVKYDGKDNLTIVNKRIPNTDDDTPIQSLLLSFLLSLSMMMVTVTEMLRRWRRRKLDS